MDGATAAGRAPDPADATLEALPVALDLGAPDAARVEAWIEGVLGWQPVSGDGVGLAPRARVVDVAAATRSGRDAELPTVLLVAGDDAAVAVADAAVRVRPEAVVAWPDRRDDLAGTVARLLAVPTATAAGASDLRVGGAAGGVGTTTVCLALAALTAWRSGPTLAVTHGAVPLEVARVVAVTGLAGPRAWGDAHTVPGIPDLRVVVAEGPAATAAVAAEGAAVIRDVGVHDEADVLCVRRDRTGIGAVETTAAAAIVVLDEGPVPSAAVRAAAAGRRLVTVPRSTRVARAAALRRVPALLPGSYLRALAGVVGGGAPCGGGSVTAAVDPGLRTAVERHVLDDADVAAAPHDRAGLRRAVARALAAEGVVVSPARWAALVRDLVDDLGGLGPLEALLRDPQVTDVMVNAVDEVWVDRAGEVTRVATRFDDEDHLRRVLARALGPVGGRLDRAHPWVDAVLPGGLRLHAVLPPLAERPVVTLRRVAAVVPSWDELTAAGAVDHDQVVLLRQVVRDRRNLVVCGRAGVGKTTLLARLLADAGDDRVVVIEDAPELAHPAPHSVHLRVVPPSPDGAGGTTVAELVRNALRMRPDRLVVGEVRGAEVADLLQAMNTGHDGSMSTVHANGAGDALVRLEGMALLAGLPLAAVRSQLASALDVVVALDRDRRRGRHVAAIGAVRPGADGPQVTELTP